MVLCSICSVQSELHDTSAHSAYKTKGPHAPHHSVYIKLMPWIYKKESTILQPHANKLIVCVKPIVAAGYGGHGTQIDNGNIKIHS